MKGKNVCFCKRKIQESREQLLLLAKCASSTALRTYKTALERRTKNSLPAKRIKRECTHTDTPITNILVHIPYIQTQTHIHFQRRDDLDAWRLKLFSLITRKASFWAVLRFARHSANVLYVGHTQNASTGEFSERHERNERLLNDDERISAVCSFKDTVTSFLYALLSLKYRKTHFMLYIAWSEIWKLYIIYLENVLSVLLKQELHLQKKRVCFLFLIQFSLSLFAYTLPFSM